MEFFKFSMFFEYMHGVFAQSVERDNPIHTSYAYKQFLWLYLLAGGVCFAVFYALEAAALYKIAARNGYARKWMAFVPVLNTYYIGVVSEKNRVYNLRTTTISTVAATLEGAFIALYVLYYIATFIIFGNGYSEPIYTPQIYGNITIDVLDGYKLVGMPESLSWTVWVFDNLYYIIEPVNLLLLLANIMLLISFFQTYSPRQYFLYSLLSVLFPIKGAFMFAARKGVAVNYRDYLIERQKSRYRMYQEYMRDSGQPPFNGYNPQGGAPSGGRADEPFSEYGNRGGKDDADEDPFDGLGK